MILDICAMLWESKNLGLVCFESNVIFVVSANLSLFLKNVFSDNYCNQMGVIRCANLEGILKS